MNKIIDYPSDNAITQEASEWVICLDREGPIDSTQAQALREWVQRSPRHREEITRLAMLWGRMDALATLLSAPRTSRRTLVRRVAVAAAVLLAVVVAWPLWQHASTNAAMAYHTQTGEQRRVLLADGSVVLLDTASEVRVDLTPSERHITLVNGKAHFEVTPDPSRPFVVDAGEGTVRAVGTAFSVYRKGSVVDVAVTEGKVEVRARAHLFSTQPAASPVMLHAQQRTRLDDAPVRIQPMSPAQQAQELGWQQGVLVFQGETLAQVLTEMGRYSNQRIELADPNLARLRIGGRFDAGRTDSLLKALHEGFGIQARREPGRVLLYSSDAPARQ
ncbi:MAG TPA: FecR domain-containing protein [Chiayiivirga sp.]|nr:FecR domain-containing protein [Chiayiivirga sp.]